MARTGRPKGIPGKIKEVTDIRGQRFTRWLVIGGSPSRLNGKTMWLCRCDCGAEKLVYHRYLIGGNSKSCGCLAREMTSKRNFKHGLTNTREHEIWGGIKKRCYNPNCERYKDYGGRGIIMSDDWHCNFMSFYRDMGKSPSATHSIDRINNEGNYEKGNCRWATSEEQSCHTRRTHLLTFKGKTMSIFQWAKDPMCIVNIHTLKSRIERGWNAEDSLTRPLMCKGRPQKGIKKNKAKKALQMPLL